MQIRSLFSKQVVLLYAFVTMDVSEFILLTRCSHPCIHLEVALLS